MTKQSQITRNNMPDNILQREKRPRFTPHTPYIVMPRITTHKIYGQIRRRVGFAFQFFTVFLAFFGSGATVSRPADVPAATGRL
jgi:hypothetical protein